MDWPGEKLLNKLWETIEKSGAGLFRPWQLKRVGKAETEVAEHRMLVIAAAEKRIEVIRNIVPAELPLLPSTVDRLSNESLMKIEPAWDLNLLEQNFTNSQATEYLRKEINIEKAVAHAEAALRQNEEETPDESIDMDWFFRWRDYTAGMSTDALQQLWGNVLAGEIKHPGSFSYRTLDFLRSLTQDEAKLIERLATVILEGTRFIHGSPITLLDNVKAVASPLYGGELSLLEELGILNGVSSMGFLEEAEPFHTADGRHIHLLTCNGRGILATTEDPKKSTGLGFYRLTKLGVNVLKLVDAKPDEAYLLSVAQLLIGEGFKVELGDVVDNGNGTRGFHNAISVAPPASATETIEST